MAMPKPLASLSSTLLARKGAARPAMRIAGRPYMDAAERSLDDGEWRDDLGWNDLGEDAPVAAQPALGDAPTPEVVRQQQALIAQFGTEAAPGARQSALAQGRRAAFTLRLDAERHFQLRMATAMTNRSAQQILVEALDRFLADQPAIATLAEHVQQAAAMTGPKVRKRVR